MLESLWFAIPVYVLAVIGVLAIAVGVLAWFASPETYRRVLD